LYVNDSQKAPGIPGAESGVAVGVENDFVFVNCAHKPVALLIAIEQKYPL